MVSRISLSTVTLPLRSSAQRSSRVSRPFGYASLSHASPAKPFCHGRDFWRPGSKSGLSRAGARFALFGMFAASRSCT